MSNKKLKETARLSGCIHSTPDMYPHLHTELENDNQY